MYPDGFRSDVLPASDQFWPGGRPAGRMATMRATLVLLAILTALIACSSTVSADSPPNITSDIPWTDSGGVFDPENGIYSAAFGGVNDIEAAYNNARRQEESQLGLSSGKLGTLDLPTQSTWDTYTDDQKAKVILNAERVARNGMTAGVIGLPFTAVQVNVDNVAQGHADYLLYANKTGHTDGAGNSPFDRLKNDPVLGHCSEFLSRAENLSYFWTSGSNVPLYIERAIYNWIYDDADSGWGHREAALIQDKDLTGQNELYGFNNNVGSPADEGYIGIGVAQSATYDPYGFGWVNWGTIVVLNMIDPISTGSCPWDVAQRYPLVLSKAGTGSGSVSKQPDQADYLPGTKVTLTATPAAGSTFSGWSGDADCVDGMITMDGPRNCTATFTSDVAQRYLLVLWKAGTGSGSVGKQPDQSDYLPGTKVTLIATPAAGSIFSGWSGHTDCVDGVVTMNGVRNCTATFTSSAGKIKIYLPTVMK
jgi:uncharacterized protein YkwD